MVTPEEFTSALRQGTSNRATVATSMNEHSSRSHLVIVIYVECQEEDGDGWTSKLSLVDMAGSERLSRSEASGERMNESMHIYISLSALVRSQDY